MANNLKKRCLVLLLSLSMIITNISTVMNVYAADDIDWSGMVQQCDELDPAEEAASEDSAPEEEEIEAADTEDEETETIAEELTEELLSEASVPEEKETVAADTEDEETETTAEELTEELLSEASVLEEEETAAADTEDKETETTAEELAEELLSEDSLSEEEEIETADLEDEETEAEDEAAVSNEDISGELIAGNDKFDIIVSYDASAEIPEEATLVLTEFNKEDKEFAAARDALVADENGNSVFSGTTEEEQKNLGIVVFDLTIYDKDGNAVEPKAEVKVSFRLKTLPEGVDIKTLAHSMEIQHLNESSGSIVVEKIATIRSGEDEANESVGKIEINEKEETVEVKTTVDSFSIYTITWENGAQHREVVIHFVDDKGNDLGNGFTYNGQSVDNGTINLTDLISGNGLFDLSQFKKEGYSLSNVHINQIEDMNGNTPTIIRNEIERADNALRYWTFNTGSDTAGVTRRDFPEGRSDLYLVYNSTSMASPGSGSQDSGDTPDLADLGHNKVANSNEDGTYKLSLSVTGSAQNKETNPHVNVIIVFDTSSSMVSNYIPGSGSMTRLEAAKDQVNELATELLANNTAEHPDTVEMALVTFNRNASIEGMGGSYWTTSASTYTSVVGTYRNGPRTNNNQGTAGAGNTGINTAKGTNWAQGIQKTIDLMQDAGTDNDPTYVLFITDGAPSQYWPSGQATGTYAEGEGCYLGARDEARRLVGDEGAIFYALFTYGSDTDYNKDYLGKLVDYAYNNTSAKNNYRFNVADNSAFKQRLKAILGIISMNFAYANVSIDDGVTGLSTVVFERIATDSFTYSITYRDYSSSTEYTNKTITPLVNADGSVTIPAQTYKVPDKSSPNGLRTINTEQATVTGAQYSEGSKSVIWDIKKAAAEDGSDLYLLEEGWTYTVNFDIWPSQVSYDLVAALNNGILVYGDPYQYTDENGNLVTVPFSEYQTQVTDTKPYTLLTNTHFTIKYQQVTEVINPDGTISYELGPEKPIEDPYTYQMPLESQLMPVKKEFAHSINAQDPYTKIRFYLLMDGGYYQSDGTLSETLVPYTGNDEAVHTICMDLDDSNEWTGSIYIAPGVIKDERAAGGQMLVLETGHEYTLEEEVLEGPVYEYEFTPQTVRPMVINGKLTYLVKEDKYNKPSDSDTIYEMNGDRYFPASENAQLLIGTNRKTAELDITKIVKDPDGLLTEDQEGSETFTYRVTLMIPDGADPAGIVGYEYVPRTQANAFLLYGYQNTDAGQGFPEDVERFSGATYRAWNTLVYRDLIEWETVDGKIKAKTDENGNIIWIVPAVDGYHTVTYDMTLKQDEVIRFTNLPSGTKYTIQEIYANKYPADNVGGTTSGRAPVEDPGNLEDQGYTITRIQSTGVNEETAEINEAGDTISGVISNLDTRYYNQFTNTIGAVVEAELNVTKHLDGYEWNGERYYFDLNSESDTAPLPGANGGRISLYTKAASGNEDVTQSFGRIRFSAPGEYTYTITERIPTDPDDDNNLESDRRPNITYDTSEKQVTIVVKVSDKGLYIDSITGEDGTDYLSVDFDSQPVSAAVKVTNTYKAAPTEINFTASKIAKGFDLKDGQFSFLLTAGTNTADGNIETPMPEAATAVNDEDGNVVFGNISYSVPGVYKYTITEEVIVGDEITDDTHVCHVTVTVTDNNEGTLTATVAYDNNTFINIHTDDKKEVVIPGTAEISVDGTIVEAGQILTYYITYANNTAYDGKVTVTDTIPTNTTIVDGTISDGGVYAGGVITWTFENVPAGASGRVSFQVKVNDAAGETIENTAVVDDGENKSETNTTTSNIPKKEVENATDPKAEGDVQVGDTLTYTVTFKIDVPVDKVIVTDTVPAGTVYVADSAKAEWATAIDYSDEVLTWTFTGTDNSVLAAGTYSATFQVTVTEEALKTGEIENTATISVNDGPEVKTNPVKNDVERGGLTISKTVVVPAGFEIDENKTFTFKVNLTDKNDTALTGEYKYTGDYEGTIKNGGEITLRHGESITIEGLPEGAKYSITEQTVDGYKATAAALTGVVIAGETAEVTEAFENRYEITKPAETSFNATKKADGFELEDKQFTFMLAPGMATYADGTTAASPLPDGATDAITATNDADGNVVFDRITFTKPGEYKYRITEVVIAADGITDDTHECEVTVTVTDKGDGTLAASAPVYTNNTFTNVHKENKKDVIVPGTTDVYVDGALVEPGQILEYIITYVNNTANTGTVTVKDSIPRNTTLVEGSCGNGVYEDGIITWMIENVPAGGTGEVSFQVTVNEVYGIVIENTAKIDDGENNFESNTVETSVPVKKVRNEDGELISDGGEVQVGDTITYEVSFTLTQAVESAVVTDAVPEHTSLVKIEDGGVEADGIITWTLGALEAGDYSVSFQVMVDETAVTVDEINNTAFIKINDNPEVKTNETKIGTETGALEVTKTVVVPEGFEIDADKTFIFTVGLTDKNDAALTGEYKCTGDYEGTIKNGGEITLRHGELITIEGLPAGAKFSITEAAEAGYTAAEAAITGTVAAGETAEVTVAFENTYAITAPGKAQLGVEKIIENRDLAEGEFRFELKNEDGSVLQTRANDADGKVVFDELEYTKPGTYIYTVTEVNAGKGGIIYDDQVISIKVTVTDNGDGTLSTEVEYPDNTTFINVYELIDIKVTKIWDDQDDKYGVRPESVSVDLIANDEIIDTVELSEANNLTYTFVVPKCDADGKPIEYDADEQFVTAGYVKAKTGNASEGFTFINSFVPPFVAPQVSKEIRGDKPVNEETFTFKLTAVSFVKGEGATEDFSGNMPMPEAAKGAQEMTINIVGEGWNEFGKYALYVPGVYTYTVTEVNNGTDGYIYDEMIYTIEFTVTPNEDNALECITKVNNTLVENAGAADITFINEFRIPTIDIAVLKVWKDTNNKEGERPDSIKVQLLADGKEIDGGILTLTADTGWSGVFKDMPKYAADGKTEIIYTIKEGYVKDYKVEITGNAAEGFIITNTYEPDVPQTGDSAHMGIYICGMICSAAALAFILFFGRRRREYEE